MTNTFPERPTREHFDTLTEGLGGTPAHLNGVIKIAREFFGDPRETSEHAAEHVRTLLETHPDFTNPETGGRTKLYFCFWAITEFFLRDKSAHTRLRQFLASKDFPNLSNRDDYVSDLLASFLPEECTDEMLIATVEEGYGEAAGHLINVLLTSFNENYSHGLQRRRATENNSYKKFLTRMQGGAATMHRFLVNTSLLLDLENTAVDKYIRVTHPDMTPEDARKNIAKRSLRLAQQIAMNHIIFSEELLFKGVLHLYEIPQSGGGYDVIVATESLYNLYRNKQVSQDIKDNVSDGPSTGCPMAFSGVFLEVGNAMIGQLYPKK